MHWQGVAATITELEEWLGTAAERIAHLEAVQSRAVASAY
jgi:hypothetical protein